MPTQQEYLQMLEDPNQFSPLYGATPELSSGRLSSLQDLSGFLGSFDPNIDSTDEYTPESMGEFQDELGRYIGSQEAYNRALGAGGGTVNDAETQRLGKQRDEYKNYLGVLEQLAKIPLNPMQLNVGGQTGSAEYLKNLYGTWLGNTERDLAAYISKTKQKSSDEAKEEALRKFALPNMPGMLTRNRLNRQLTDVTNMRQEQAKKNIYAQGWLARQNTAEILNRSGQFRSGAAKKSREDIKKRELGAYAEEVGQTEAEKAARLSEFDTGMESSKTKLSDLENKIKNQGFEALSSGAFGNEVNDLYRQGSMQAKDLYSNAMADLQKSQAEGDVFGDILNKIGRGAGMLTGANI